MSRLQLYGHVLAKINGRFLKEQCAITLTQACGVPDRVTIKSVVPSVGFEFEAHKQLGKVVRLSLHLSTGHYDKVLGCLKVGDAILAYRVRIISAELSSAVHAATCSSFVCVALPQPASP